MLTLDFFILSFWRDSIPWNLWFNFSESVKVDSRPRFFIALYEKKEKSHLFVSPKNKIRQREK